MTVTELREALQKLEAEGKGALPVVCDDGEQSVDNCRASLSWGQREIVYLDGADTDGQYPGSGQVAG